MKWKAPILSRRDRLTKRGKHQWFAWFPVRANDECWYWLEHVNRTVSFPMGYRVNRYSPLEWKQ